ncbi:ArsR/SmtB family transcription factor [Cellulosimicrobium sp. Marseille-Q8652]
MRGKMGAMTTTVELTPAPPTAPAAAGCCAPLVREAADPEVARDIARVFKALGDPTRVQLLSIVAAHDGGEACVCDLTGPVGLAQPTVSHHLKILVEAGLLTREQRGRWAYYSLVPGALTALAAVLTETARG